MPGNRLLGERAQRVRHGADEPAVDVDRAAAHAGDDAGVGERPAFEPRENQIAVRADDVLEHAENVDLELLDAGALEYRPADRDHAGTDFVDVHASSRRSSLVGWRLLAATRRATSTPSPVSVSRSAMGSRRMCMGFDFHYSGEVLAGQGEMAVRG